MPQMELRGATHVGLVRKNNEDAYAILPELGLAIVADGMGGAACGEVAAALTIETVAEFLRGAEAMASEEELLREAVRKANRRVLEAAASRADCHGMGSTVVLALWRQDRVWIANVGDSRAYRLRRGELTQLSYDQNVANELRVSLGLTEDQIKGYPQRNALTMAIGCSRELLVIVKQESLIDGDMLLLCSDGLYNPCGTGSIRTVIGGLGPLEDQVDELIWRALDGGGTDNVTVVLMRWRAD